MDKIQIVNFLLTRRCNLQCSYCRIARDYNGPDEYKSLKDYYYKNEISTGAVFNFLNKLKLHNPNAFVIFYGGEPLLRDDLPLIINHCNYLELPYTIITNNSDEVQDRLNHLIRNEEVKGLTSSIDPVIFDEKAGGDIKKKSIAGFERLANFRDKVKDLVAEITVTNDTIEFLPSLVKMLTDKGISSSITFLDISKNIYYDFSTITNKNLLVNPTERVIEILNDLYNDKSLDIHMREQLLLFPGILPSDLDCRLEDELSNLTVDSDGSIRLCLRIRGVNTPETINIYNIFDTDGSLNPEAKLEMSVDKKVLCEKCNWTCMLHSQLSSMGHVDDLLHSEKRGSK